MMMDTDAGRPEEEEQAFLDLLRAEFDNAEMVLTQEIYAAASRAHLAVLRAREASDSDTHPKGGDASGSGSAE